MEPLVSVIVATYNRFWELERALLSLKNQSYPNLEVIVIDDNADSEKNEKVSQIIHSTGLDITYIKNEVQKGSAQTRNEGIKKANNQPIHEYYVTSRSNAGKDIAKDEVAILTKE